MLKLSVPALQIPLLMKEVLFTCQAATVMFITPHWIMVIQRVMVELSMLQVQIPMFMILTLQTILL